MESRRETIRRYSELIEFDTFEGRLNYLMLNDRVGHSTFGHDRYLNQRFYKSVEWASVRREVLIRDNGCDLGVEGYDIRHSAYIHHVNPVTPDDLIQKRDWVLDPEFLITVTHNTHNIIHYGLEDILVPTGPRTPGDTKLW